MTKLVDDPLSLESVWFDIVKAMTPCAGKRDGTDDDVILRKLIQSSLPSMRGAFYAGAKTAMLMLLNGRQEQLMADITAYTPKGGGGGADVHH